MCFLQFTLTALQCSNPKQRTPQSPTCIKPEFKFRSSSSYKAIETTNQLFSLPLLECAISPRRQVVQNFVFSRPLSFSGFMYTLKINSWRHRSYLLYVYYATNCRMHCALNNWFLVGGGGVAVTEKPTVKCTY